MKQAQKLPDEIVRKLTSKNTIRVSFGDKGKAIGKGERNERLFKAACAFRRQALPHSWCMAGLTTLNKLCDEPVSQNELKAILKSSSRYDEKAVAEFRCMSEIESQKVDWFWYPYMPSGSIVFLDGHPGRGKSFFTMWLAALCSNGGKFPFSEERIKRGRVLILNAEDDPKRTMRPRLEKAGADLSPNKIHFQGSFKPLTKEGLQTFEAKVISFKPDLVIIDPLLTYMGGGVDTNQFSQVTEFLTYVDQISRDHKLCVVCVRHMTKSSGEQAINKGLGSIGFAARARSVLHIGKSRDDDDVIGFAHVKSNWSETGDTLLYKLVGGSKTEWPKLEWVGVADYTAEALDPIQSVGRPKAEPHLSDILIELLSIAPSGIAHIQKTIQNRGMDVSKSTVIRELRSIANLRGKGSKSLWHLK